ncbi:MAG: pyridoxamine 5'-phosphate oxidase [Hyphococcus sp.]|nr:MAG: pyridoxamine 5'-phosphate oxidase [Marinicaulis sp.]
MAKVYERLTEKHIEFIKKQKMFFVATAPLSADGSVNVSPKGYDSLRIVDDTHVEWVDLGGSGIETVAHLRENARITLMFCAVEGAANILRLYGKGSAITFDDPNFSEALSRFDGFDRGRAIIRIEIERVSDSCGWGVPFYEYKGERDQLRRSIEHRTEDEWKKHRYNSNAASVDGLLGLLNPTDQAGLSKI